MSHLISNAAMIGRVMAGDETLCFQFDLKARRQNTHYKTKNSTRPSRERTTRSQFKTTLTCFADYKEIVYYNFYSQGQHPNQDDDVRNEHLPQKIKKIKTRCKCGQSANRALTSKIKEIGIEKLCTRFYRILEKSWLNIHNRNKPYTLFPNFFPVKSAYFQNLKNA